MRRPAFLVIGAMKAGTTTLYHDLRAHRRIFLSDKESDSLCREITTDDYARLFAPARPGQICGEVSTRYAMLPDSADVVPRARRMFPSGTKVVYIVREPVSRTLSHHRHMSTWRGEGRMEPDVNRAIHKHPELINYSRYALQVRPWIEAFGREAIHVIRFEDYIQRRVDTLGELFRFLGVEPQTENIEVGAVHNRSAGKPVLNGFWTYATRSPVYRRLIRPMTSLRTRDRLRAWLLPKARQPIIPPGLATIDTILGGVRDDVGQLAELLGHGAPLWDLRAVRRSYEAKSGASVAESSRSASAHRLEENKV